MITVTAEQRVRPGKEDDVDWLMARLMDQIASSEPGCVRFDYVVDDGDPGRRLVIETYADEVAFAEHVGSQYLADFLPRLLDCLVEPPAVRRYGDALPRTATPTFFHTGIVVEDLDKAVAYYDERFGMTFTKPGRFVIPRLEDPDPHPFELVAVISRSDPPYLELIQAAGTGIVSTDKCGQILYHGYWEPDMTARWEWLQREGPGVDAAFRMDEHSPPFAVISAADPFGNRMEYVGVEAMRQMNEWAHTGCLPAGIGQS